MESNNLLRKVFLGSLFIGIGIMLLAINLDILPAGWKEYVINWRALVVLAGLISITKRGGLFTGFILLVVAGFLYMPMLLGYCFEFQTIFWPLVLIGVGLLIIRRRRDNNCDGRRKCNGTSKNEKAHDINEHVIDEVSVFSGSETVVLSDRFEGGSIVAIFGGINVNFQKSRLAPGKNNLEVMFAFGGCKLQVPPDWCVKLEVISIFGGCVDKRMFSEVYPNPEKVLVIKGYAIFGGCEIRN